jgi:hypothetical protein
MSKNKEEILRKAQNTRKDEREIHMDLKATKIAWGSLVVFILIIATIRITNYEPIYDLLTISAGGSAGYQFGQSIQSKKWSSIFGLIFNSILFIYFGYQFFTQYGVL